MQSEALAHLIRTVADDKKAEDIVALDVRGLSSVTDFFVLATGNSEPHIRAIVNAISDELTEKHRLHASAIDGKGNSSWVVLDYIDVIVHVMNERIRAMYDLESLWGDAVKITGSRNGGGGKQASRTRQVASRA